MKVKAVITEVNRLNVPGFREVKFRIEGEEASEGSVIAVSVDDAIGFIKGKLKKYKVTTPEDWEELIGREIEV